MNKRGLSDVVTTVLIILLVVAAIAAIWLFIRPTISNAGTSISKGEVCMTNKVELINCVNVSIGNQQAYTVSYRVILDSDVDSVNMSQISLEFFDGSIGGVTGIGKLNSGQSTSTSILSTKAAKNALLSAQFLLKDGSTKMCDSTPIRCINPTKPVSGGSSGGITPGGTFNQTSGEVPAQDNPPKSLVITPSNNTNFDIYPNQIINFRVVSSGDGVEGTKVYIRRLTPSVCNIDINYSSYLDYQFNWFSNNVTCGGEGRYLIAAYPANSSGNMQVLPGVAYFNVSSSSPVTMVSAEDTNNGNSVSAESRQTLSVGQTNLAKATVRLLSSVNNLAQIRVIGMTDPVSRDSLGDLDESELCVIYNFNGPGDYSCTWAVDGAIFSSPGQKFYAYSILMDTNGNIYNSTNYIPIIVG